MRNGFFMCIVALLLCVGACNRLGGYQKFLYDVVGSSEIDLSNFDSIVVIPGSGCPGCISEAEKYCRQSLDRQDKVLFIFTNIVSVKGLHNKFSGLDIFHMEKVLIDTNNVYYNAECQGNIYPQRIILSEGTIKTVKEL